MKRIVVILSLFALGSMVKDLGARNYSGRIPSQVPGQASTWVRHHPMPKAPHRMSHGIASQLPPHAVVDAARKAAVHANIMLPANFGLNFKKLSQDRYEECFFFPTSRDGKHGVAACQNARRRGAAVFAWKAIAQCLAGVAPLSSTDWQHLGSFAHEMLMGGPARRCKVYGKIDRRPVMHGGIRQ